MPAHLSTPWDPKYAANFKSCSQKRSPTPSDRFIHPVDQRSEGLTPSPTPIKPVFFEKLYEQQAIKFLQSTKFQIGIPDPQLQVDDTKENKHLRLYQHIALLLQYREHGDEVTAVTMSVQLGVRNPIFEIVYAKNKRVLQEGDVMRGEQLVQIIKNNASNTKDEFLSAIFGYMTQHSSSKFERACRKSDAYVTPLLEQLSHMINMPETQTQWQYKAINPMNSGDEIIKEIYEVHNISPLKALQCLLFKILQSATEYSGSSQPEEKKSSLLNLSKSLFHVRTSKLFRKFSRRITKSVLHQLAIDFWEHSRMFGSYYDNTVLMYSYLSSDPYKTGLPHLSIKGVNQISESDVKKLEEKFSLEEPLYSNVAADIPPAIDFFELLAKRANRRTIQLNGLRSDFLIKYKELLEWDSHISHKTLHTEIKLALNLLFSKHKSDIPPVAIIGVSKAPCYLCETFFQTCNTRNYFPTKFLLSPGHSKIYSGWEFSNIRTVDQSCSLQHLDACG